MIPIKSERDLRVMRGACAIAATVLDKLCRFVREGVSTLDIDLAAKKYMEELRCRSACYHYRAGHLRFPAYICVSVNDEVIHGIGDAKRVLKNGDIVSMDVSTVWNGFVGDNTRTVIVGTCDPKVKALVDCTDRALHAGIAAASEGNRVGDISAAIQSVVDAEGYGIVEEFTGHGVGREMHEDPQITNYGKAGTGPRLRAGMTLAIEPMINMGSKEIIVEPDGWTVRTADGLPSCHIEHTVLVTANGGEILTLPLTPEEEKVLPFEKFH